jgi:flavodoxin I
VGKRLIFLQEGQMNVLVTYYSETKNTEKLAEAIYDAIVFVQKRIAPIKTAGDVTKEDLYFVGFPVHNHSVPPKVEKFLKNIPERKKIALFATHGSMRGGALAVEAFYDALGLAQKKTVLGTFGCRGEVRKALIERLMKRPEDRYWTMEAESAKGHPDQADLEEARQWARWMVMKAQSF